ncbi:GGDEF domain-containing protein [Tumebacillus sp. DT12]|uniref:GGDEF domain-containing protein n=1 Tax=Tumebacillus lacus TaxID=2995335 RepID=A0ABT3WVS6_9BACL|nr:GGDEF domain-containing protein [Tumebacillus lacus]MCX7568770.1 GGDEF domain-containing protein [Tumebacillus lacus]
MSFQRLAIGTILLGALLVSVVAATNAQPTFGLADSSILLVLIAFYAFTEFFPLKRLQHTISLSSSVELLIFLKFGLIPVVLISQVLISVSRWANEKKLDLWKIMANGGMFLVLSGGSASVFYLMGGSHSAALFHNLLPLLTYILAHFVLNYLLLFIFLRNLSGIRLKDFLSDAKFDLISSLFAASLGLLVILLYEGDGLYGLLAIGIPMILCVYVFKLFNDVWRSNALFRNLAALTGIVSGELAVSALSRQVTQELPKWFQAAHCVIFMQSNSDIVPLSVSADCPEDAVAAMREYLIRTSGPSRMPYLAKRLSEEPEFTPLSYRALLVTPFLTEPGQFGYCCLLSNENEFDSTSLDATAILANQLGVSYRNAMRYEHVEKQSLYDELTQLPNHRFCERRLREEVERLHGSAPLSLLLIDLDHFKQINDRYGHLAGNTVLRSLARTFENCLRNNDFVSRYGGEEFIVVLPGADKEIALTIAEKIRASVASKKITVSDMDNVLSQISLTVSIGVATIPDDTEDEQQLLRFADRAMYYGAKQAGRNRVAAYEID